MRLKNHYYFLRHGKVDWQKKDIAYPPDNMTSVRLTSEGIRQIISVAKKLEKKHIDLIFSSDYLRARQTARIVADTLDLKVILDKRLGDTNLGVYHGKLKADFYKRFLIKTRFEKGPKNGESWNDVRERVASFFKSIEKKYRGKNILIVGHGDPLWLLEGVLRGLTNQELLDLILVKKEYIQKGELRKISLQDEEDHGFSRG
jgi:broad specificity phosphatase PhoE